MEFEENKQKVVNNFRESLKRRRAKPDEKNFLELVIK
jgi:hypothetical protein